MLLVLFIQLVNRGNVAPPTNEGDTTPICRVGWPKFLDSGVTLADTNPEQQPQTLGNELDVYLAYL
jgi:hypothetical protein